MSRVVPAAGDSEQCLSAIPLGHVLERVGVHEHEVVDEGQRLAHEHGAGGAAHGRRPLSGGLGTRPGATTGNARSRGRRVR